MDPSFPFETCAVLLAALCGMCLWVVLDGAMRERRFRKGALADIGQASELGGRDISQKGTTSEGALAHKALAMAQTATQRRNLRQSSQNAHVPRWWKESRWLSARVKQAGLSQTLSAQGYHEANLKLALLGGALGALVGAVFSLPAAVLGVLLGAVVGAGFLRRAIEGRITWRTKELERHLPEMLDVMAMGLRSGLSFDRSLQLYLDHYSTMLSQSVAEAKRQWSYGLTRRDDALRALAETYDSLLFSRVVENMIRSLHYGSSMADSLESAAQEARQAYQAKKQEEVAKAPVKMMLPTGALILPAMLLFVLGPVLLELVEGF